MLFAPTDAPKKFGPAAEKVRNTTKNQLAAHDIRIDEPNIYSNISPNGKIMMFGFPLIRGAWWKTSDMTPVIAVVASTDGHRRRRLYIGVDADDGGGVVLRTVNLGVAKSQQPLEDEISERMNKVTDIMGGLHHVVRELMGPAVQPNYANAFLLKMARQQARKYKLPYSYMGFADQAYLEASKKTQGVISKWDLLVAYSHGVLATKPAEFHPDKLMAGKIILTKEKKVQKAK